jgi:peptide deformylase
MLQKSDPISPIVQDGNPVLRAIAHPVPKADFGSKKLNDILDQMTRALAREHDGVAIAAPQIGVPLRIFIVARGAFAIIDGEKNNNEAADVPAKAMPEKNMIAINPEIIKLSRKKVKVPEGCLSVRWLYGNTIRSEKALLRAYDENGKLFTYGGSGLVAQIFQHETDHLNGILFIDHATEIEELSPEEIAKIQAEAKKNSSQ